LNPFYAIMSEWRWVRMQYQVLVQNLPDGLFSAFVIGVPDVVAEGATVEEVLNNAKTLLKERLATSRLFTIEVEDAPAGVVANPWLETHGVLRDDTTFDDWVEEIAKYRREVDDGESQPWFDTCWILIMSPCISEDIYRWDNVTLIPPDEIATTTITAEEQLRGRLAQIKKASTTEALAIAHSRFRQAIYDLAKLNILEFNSAAITVFKDLKRQRLRAGSQDLRITATAIANGAIVVTRNRVDFGQISGLQIEDWTVWYFDQASIRVSYQDTIGVQVVFIDTNCPLSEAAWSFWWLAHASKRLSSAAPLATAERERVAGCAPAA
jgi:tRNA(fMet)-specific endonuclease VapC